MLVAMLDSGTAETFSAEGQGGRMDNRAKTVLDCYSGRDVLYSIKCANFEVLLDK